MKGKLRFVKKSPPQCYDYHPHRIDHDAAEANDPDYRAVNPGRL